MIFGFGISVEMTTVEIELGGGAAVVGGIITLLLFVCCEASGAPGVTLPC